LDFSRVKNNNNTTQHKTGPSDFDFIIRRHISPLSHKRQCKISSKCDCRSNYRQTYARVFVLCFIPWLAAIHNRESDKRKKTCQQDARKT